MSLVQNNMKLNRKLKNGSWTLSGEYLSYRGDGGNLSPEAYNQRLKEIKQAAYVR